MVGRGAGVVTGKVVEKMYSSTFKRVLFKFLGQLARVYLWWGKDNKANGVRLVVFWWGRNGGVSCRRNGGKMGDRDKQCERKPRKDKIGSKPDKKGKRVEAGKSLKHLQ
nr:hypothetical protein [Tanacetum cinerariifolium]